MSTILVNHAGPADFEPDSGWKFQAVQVEGRALRWDIKLDVWTSEDDRHRVVLSPAEARQVAAALLAEAERVEEREFAEAIEDLRK